MGAKKKVEPQPAPVPQAVEKNSHSQLKVVTSDLKQFKVGEELFSRHSAKAKVLSETSKDGTIRLEDISSQQFEFILAYLDLHNKEAAPRIVVPIRSNQSCRNIMDEGDAELMERAVEKGDLFVSQLLDAALWLEMETLRRRLSCAVAMKVMGLTVDELREMYGIEDSFEEEFLRNSTRPMIEEMKKHGMEEEG